MLRKDCANIPWIICSVDDVNQAVTCYTSQTEMFSDLNPLLTSFLSGQSTPDLQEDQINNSLIIKGK